MTNWSFGAASVRGTSHIKNGTRIQDAKRCFELKLKNGASVFCAVVSDGAGSASHGGEGANIVCRSFGEFLRQHFLNQTGEFPTEDLLWDWLDETRDRISLAATNRSIKTRDFAATLIVAVTNGHHTLTAHIGDGVIVARTSENQKWQVFSPSENGEYASTTFFVTDTGTPRFRIATWNAEIDAIFVFSDGIENQVMDLATGEPYENFFGPMAKPFSLGANSGRNFDLSQKLANYLDSEKFAELTDDDKTLVIAVRK